MSVAEVIEKLSTGASAAPAAPATPPVAPEETKVPVIPAEGQPVAEETAPEIPLDGTEAEPEIETEPDLEVQPETSGDFAKYKPLFKENPELRQILGREKAFSELGDFSTVREVMQRVPTIEDAETLVADADTKRTFSQTYREDPTQFVESLKESDALAFQQLAAKLPEILAQTDERLWREQATSYTSTVLGNLYAIAQQSQDAELVKAVQLISNGLGMPIGTQQPQRVQANPELEKLRRELAERKQQDATQAFESFWSQTDNAVIETTLAEIEKTLKTSVPNATAPQLKRMVNEVYANTIANLGAQPQFVSQMDTFRANAKKGRLGIADHKAIVDFATKRSKLVIPKAAKDVINEWSGSILTATNAEIEKKKAIAKATKDVGKGPQGTSAVGAPPPTNKPASVKSIFERLENQIRGVV